MYNQSFIRQRAKRTIFHWGVSVAFIFVCIKVITLAPPPASNDSLSATSTIFQNAELLDGTENLQPGGQVRCISHPELGIGSIVAIGMKYQVFFPSKMSYMDIEEDKLLPNSANFDEEPMEFERVLVPRLLHTSVIWREHPEFGVGQAISAWRVLTVKYQSGIRTQEGDVVPIS